MPNDDLSVKIDNNFICSAFLKICTSCDMVHCTVLLSEL